MREFLMLIQKLITNPKVTGYAIIFLSSIISKKISMDEATPARKQPLYLPRGSVRAVIALILLGTSIGDYVMGSWSLPEEFHAMTIAAVAYYIGYRSDNAQTKEIKI